MPRHLADCVASEPDLAPLGLSILTSGFLKMDWDIATLGPGIRILEPQPIAPPSASLTFSSTLHLFLRGWGTEAEQKGRARSPRIMGEERSFGPGWPFWETGKALPKGPARWLTSDSLADYGQSLTLGFRWMYFPGPGSDSGEGCKGWGPVASGGAATRGTQAGYEPRLQAPAAHGAWEGRDQRLLPMSLPQFPLLAPVALSRHCRAHSRCSALLADTEPGHWHG